jgi:hypothetical protein
MTGEQPASSRWWNWLALAVGIIGFVLFLAFQIPPANGIQIDFFIYSSGVKMAWAGEWPYDPARMTEIVAAAFPPGPGDVPVECGFFLSPQAIALLAPWAFLPWTAARWAWVATSALGAVACGSLAWTFGRAPACRGAGWGLIAAAVLLNPLTLRAVSLGQTALFIVGCVAAGQYARERGRPVLAALLWSACGLKPHLGLPLILFTAYQGGLRWAAAVAAAVAAGVVLGAAVLGNPVTVILDYALYLGPRYQAVGFNRVAYDQILSWNRLVAAVGGPHIELSAGPALAGVAVAAGLLWAVRVRNRPRPSDSWALAAAVAWAPLVGPLHGYELVAWALMAPYLCTMADRRRWADLVFVLTMMGIASIPRAVIVALVARWPASADVALSYRSVVVLVVALYFLLRSPVAVAEHVGVGNQRGRNEPEAEPSR